jgi:hypothetical protein
MSLSPVMLCLQGQHVVSQTPHVFIIEHYSASWSYEHNERQFWETKPSSHVPQKITVARLVDHFCKKGGVDNTPGLCNHCVALSQRRYRPEGLHQQKVYTEGGKKEDVSRTVRHIEKYTICRAANYIKSWHFPQYILCILLHKCIK